jgi:hypothetical protein
MVLKQKGFKLRPYVCRIPNQRFRCSANLFQVPEMQVFNLAPSFLWLHAVTYNRPLSRYFLHNQPIISDICIYIYIYIHIHMYIYVCMYAYT